MTDEERSVFSTHTVLTLMALTLAFGLLSVFAMFFGNKAAIDSYDKYKAEVLTYIEENTEWKYSLKDSVHSIIYDKKSEVIGFSNRDGNVVTLKSTIHVGLWDMSGSIDVIGANGISSEVLDYKAAWSYSIREKNLSFTESGDIKKHFIDPVLVKDSVLKGQ